MGACLAAFEEPGPPNHSRGPAGYHGGYHGGGYGGAPSPTQYAQQQRNPWGHQAAAKPVGEGWGGVGAATSAPRGAAGDPVSGFDEILAGPLASMATIGALIGGEVAQATALLADAFRTERDIVVQIASSPAPGADGVATIGGQIGAKAGAVIQLSEGRRGPAFNHQKVVAEAVPALYWVVYTGPECGMSAPPSYVEEMWQAAEFYVNKVMMEHRGQDDRHVAWCKATKDTFQALAAYVRRFHPRGPAWGTGGGAGAAAPLSRPPASGAGLLGDLSRGPAGLRKVTDDMKSKNLPSAPLGASAPPPKAGPGPKGPPVFSLEQSGRKWIVENQVDNKGLVIADTNPRQAVYIYGCKGSVIQVKGKVNQVTLDNCVKTALVFDELVASLEVVNCASVEVQCMVRASTYVIDNTNSCQLYLPPAARDARVVTSKSSAVNVMMATVPGGELVETPVAEQFVTSWRDGRWITEPADHTAEDLDIDRAGGPADYVPAPAWILRNPDLADIGPAELARGARDVGL